MNRAIRVLIADDSFIVRGGLRTAVEALPGFTVVGEASTGHEALGAAHALRPDIVLMDLRMPDGDGIAATRRITSDLPAVRTLVVTWSDAPEHLRDALFAGAKGYLVHGRFDPAELAAAMRALAQDDISMTPIIATGIIAASNVDMGSHTTLTKRELEILTLVQRGRRNREIAHEIGIEEKTVKNHINSIYSKLGIASRVEAMATRLGGTPPVGPAE
jgi:DNA-binding NarL/FixJ family response regulator